MELRQRYIERRTPGEPDFERVEEARIAEDGALERVITVTGNSEEAQRAWAGLYVKLLDVEAREGANVERNRIYALDVDRKALRDEQQHALGKSELELRYFEVKEKLGIERARLWLEKSYRAHLMKRDRLELRLKGRRLVLDRRALEAEIGKAEVEALIEVKKLEEQARHHRAVEALKEGELTQREKIESAKLMLLQERLAHDKEVDRRTLAIREDEALRAWEEFGWQKQVEAVELRLKEHAERRADNEFAHQIEVDSEKLALARRAEARLQEALQWRRHKEGAELELSNRRLVLDVERFNWDREVDTEKLRQGRERVSLGWADIDLKERRLTHDEKVDVAKLEQDAQRIWLQAREVSAKERLTDHTIEMGVRQDDREERVFRRDALYQGQRLQQHERELDQGERRLGQEDERLGIERFKAATDAAYRQTRGRQIDRQLDQADERIALDQLRAQAEATYRGQRLAQYDHELAQGDRRLLQRDRELGLQAFNAQVNAADKAKRAEQRDRELTRQEREFAFKQGDAKARFELDAAGHNLEVQRHKEVVRHHLRAEEQGDKRLALDAIQAITQQRKNRASEQAELSRAQRERLKGQTELEGERRRRERMRREQKREDRRQRADGKREAKRMALEREDRREEHKLRARRDQLGHEARMAEIDRKKRRDQQIYLVRRLNVLRRWETLDRSSRERASGLSREIVRSGFQAGGQVVSSALRLVGDLAKTGGYVAGSAISATGKVASSAIQRAKGG